MLQIVDVFQDDGFSSSITVESSEDGSNLHTITHNITDLHTGETKTTYHNTIKADRVVTRLVTTEMDSVDV